MAEEMIRFFVEIGPGLASKIPNSMLELDLTPDNNLEKLELSRTNFDEVHKLLMNISDAKATGTDGIPIRFIKICYSTVVALIVPIIDRSIDTCTVPSDWKCAEVTALYKDVLPSYLYPSSIIKNIGAGCSCSVVQIYQRTCYTVEWEGKH